MAEPEIFAQAESQPLLPTDKAAERPLWVILIIMAFLAGLALLSARIGARNYAAWQTDLSGSATVQILELEKHDRSERTRQALDIIETTAPDARAVRLTDNEALALIEPWLGESLSISEAVPLPDDISIPVLIALDGSSAQNRREISARLEAEGFTVIVDDHSDWTGEISRTARAFNTASWLILVIAFFAATAATIFSTQSVMSAQAKTISVFAQIGTTDKFITKLFLKRAVKIGIISGLIGAAAALGFIALYRIIRGPAVHAALPSLSPTFADLLILIFMALVFGGVCALASSVSAKKILQKIRLYS